VWPIAPRHPSRSDSDAERPSGRYLTAGPMVRIRFPPAESQAKSLARQRLRGGDDASRRKRVGSGASCTVPRSSSALSPDIQSLAASRKHRRSSRRSSRRWPAFLLGSSSTA
jgi:hypothetical protein